MIFGLTLFGIEDTRLFSV